MAVIHPEDTGLKGIEILSREDGMKMIDELAQEYLHMSGPEFVAAWYGGKFDDDPDRPEIMDIAMLLPAIS